MKPAFVCLMLSLLLTGPFCGWAQRPAVSALKQRVAAAKTDTGRVNRLVELANTVFDDNYVSALQYADQAFNLAQKIKYKRGIAEAELILGRVYSSLANYDQSVQYLVQASSHFSDLGDSLNLARALGRLGWVNTQQGNYAAAFELGQECLRMATRYHDQPLIRRTLSHLGALHTLLGDYSLALDYLTSVMDQYEQSGDMKNVCRTLNALGELYRIQGDPEKAEEFYDKAIRIGAALNDPKLSAEAESNMAAVQTEQGRHQQAVETAHRSLRVLMAQGEYEVIAWSQTVMARAQLALNRPDSAIYYGQRGWSLSRQIGFKEAIRDASQVLSQAYERRNDFKEAFRYQQAFMAYSDTLSGSQTRQQITLLQQNIKETEQRTEEALQAEKDRRRQTWFNILLAGLVVFAVLAYILLRNNRQKQRSNALLQQQRDELEAQRDQTSQALSELKDAQTQLIHQEKLASLGELTAGIAHEIQNPLNFVNNFAEVSGELLTELREERAKGDERDPDLEEDLLDDLTQNLQKINHHGQRASGIVKSMLAHSRKGNNQKEPTDLNALADEYLRLSYHGLRAKDKDGSAGRFNCTLDTAFAPNLPLIPVVSQDIGRVLLNLFNNGFYATQQRAKLNQPGYQPVLSVRTERTETGVRIRVKDNGTGMPASVREKIFQPFFTTKPTGEGTGLGLSLSYDIITKGHGGTLSVDSQEGQGTEFVIEIPA